MSFWESWNFFTMPRQASLRPFSAHHQVMYLTGTAVWAVERRTWTSGTAAQAAPANCLRNRRRVAAVDMESPPWLTLRPEFFHPVRDASLCLPQRAVEGVGRDAGAARAGT